MNGAIRLTPYCEIYLEKSWTWLRDPEIKALTMTPDFDRNDQRQFFNGLADRLDYKIWGVELAGEGPIGAAGLKNIAGGSAEYWGYLGEKSAWGQGLGKQMLAAIEVEAAAMGIYQLYLNVTHDNLRAICLYERAGYVTDDPSVEILKMTKTLPA